ncbi:MAG: hypothetical protein GY930_04200 [bacterium]|nr:hypothetical protein [bacterium]
MRKSILFSAAASILLAGTAAAQNGADTCTMPTAIGEGSFAFNTSTMVENDNLPGCNSNLFSSSLGPFFFNKDMYWVYTATADGNLTVDTEGSSFDTQLAIHGGVDCMAICIDNNDDGGTGLLSTLTLGSINMGDQFVIQVGGYGSNSGPGILNVTLTPDPCSASNDDAFEDNDECATAVAMVNGTNTGLWLSATDHDNYRYCVGNGETLVIDALFLDDDGDIDLSLQDADCNYITGSFSISDDEHITWTNTSGADLDVVLQVFIWGSCNYYDLIVSGSGNCNGVVGTMYCDAAPNSTGAIGNIYGTGSIVAADNNFGLLAFGLPEGEFGYFLGSFGQAQINNPGGSDGNLCIGGGLAVARFLSTLGSVFGGQISGSVDLTNIPLPPTFTGMVLAGDTFYFQLWHRDGGALSGESNYTRGLEVTFQ